MRATRSLSTCQTAVVRSLISTCCLQVSTARFVRVIPGELVTLQDARYRPCEPQLPRIRRERSRRSYSFAIRRARRASEEGFVVVLGLYLSSSRSFTPLCTGLKCDNRLFVSDRAHLVFDFHQIVDGLKEVELGGSRFVLRLDKRPLAGSHMFTQQHRHY
jgi:hypothetical protein